MPLAAALVILSFGLFARPSSAHDNPTNWIGQEQRKNAIGQLCCGENDCHPFKHDQIKITPSGYQLPNGDIVPFNKAAPSADEFFWSCEWGGERKCFFAPIGAS